MSNLDGREPVSGGELLYRRVPALQALYDRALDRPLSPQAFHPSAERDFSGISLWRSAYKSAAEAAAGRPGKTYYVAVLAAADLLRNGIRIEPDVDEFDPQRGPGHVVLPQLNANNRRSAQVDEWKQLLAHELTLRVEGPFETPG